MTSLLFIDDEEGVRRSIENKLGLSRMKTPWFHPFLLFSLFFDPLDVFFELCVTSDRSHTLRFQDHQKALELWKISYPFPVWSFRWLSSSFRSGHAVQTVIHAGQ